ncbi:hypothetical protein [Ancylobacter defluvii]|uniref:Uncharacterized protein n=1 Tax=Ancylobacter defluvii TaxID=1282440 RepID=A0A9W6NDK6_9HYPH|nr:hypothetical protein [Ancylobacter defluvii]MBS7588255.1 hypothetical protein [Ancylobacter defluvii]GLK86651.1 hypothetical protein GCM10017653_47210 [Ancylobacter defluvii]
MAKYRYFADLDGETTQLLRVRHDGGVSTKAQSFIGFTEDGRELRATRMIEMKRLPSRHACDARCQNATGRIMKCECACGGRNHGRGQFIATAA